MNKNVLKIAILLTVSILFFCLHVGNASAALRNLFDEYKSAVSSENIAAVKSLLKEGLQVRDAAEYCAELVQHKTHPSDKFKITLIKTLKNAGANFADFLPRQEHSIHISPWRMISTPVLKVLLESGVDPNSYLPEESNVFLKMASWFITEGRLLFYTLSSEYTTKHKSADVIERVKTAVQHGASLDYWFGWKSSMAFFLEESWPEISKALNSGSKSTVETYTAYLLEVITILKEAGAGTAEAKKFIESKREEFRNVPDMLVYLDRLQESLTTSFWLRWKWWIITIGVLMLLGSIGS